MKVYKVEILIIDHDLLGSDSIKELIENTRYPNRCISPEVMSIEGRDIGEWSDDHPLNFVSQTEAEYKRLFG
jgi:hypothetical protein